VPSWSATAATRCGLRRRRRGREMAATAGSNGMQGKRNRMCWASRVADLGVKMECCGGKGGARVERQTRVSGEIRDHRTEFFLLSKLFRSREEIYSRADWL
jgi:hypothetical protein